MANSISDLIQSNFSVRLINLLEKQEECDFSLSLVYLLDDLIETLDSFQESECDPNSLNSLFIPDNNHLTAFSTIIDNSSKSLVEEIFVAMCHQLDKKTECEPSANPSYAEHVILSLLNSHFRSVQFAKRCILNYFAYSLRESYGNHQFLSLLCRLCLKSFKCPKTVELGFATLRDERFQRLKNFEKNDIIMMILDKTIEIPSLWFKFEPPSARESFKATITLPEVQQSNDLPNFISSIINPSVKHKKHSSLFKYESPLKTVLNSILVSLKQQPLSSALEEMNNYNQSRLPENNVTQTKSPKGDISPLPNEWSLHFSRRFFEVFEESSRVDTPTKQLNNDIDKIYKIANQLENENGVCNIALRRKEKKPNTEVDITKIGRADSDYINVWASEPLPEKGSSDVSLGCYISENLSISTSMSVT